MKPQPPERGILRDPLRRQAKTKIPLISNPVPKTYPKGGKGLGLAGDGSPWDHYASPISNEGPKTKPLHRTLELFYGAAREERWSAVREEHRSGKGLSLSPGGLGGVKVRESYRQKDQL